MTMTGDKQLYVYRWNRMGKKGEFCRVLARGKHNSCLVEFTDAHRAIISRNALRKPTEQEAQWARLLLFPSDLPQSFPHLWFPGSVLLLRLWEARLVVKHRRPNLNPRERSLQALWLRRRSNNPKSSHPETASPQPKARPRKLSRKKPPK